MKNFAVAIRVWATSFAAIVLVAILVAYHQHQVTEKYLRDRSQWCSTLPLSDKENRCEDEGPQRQSYVAWWTILVTWPEGITTWAIVITGLVVAWQSNETRKAANASVESVAASRHQASLMEKTVTLQFRPKLTVRIDDVRTSSVSPMGSRGTGNLLISVANTGGTPAYVTGSHVDTVAFDGPNVPNFFAESQNLGEYALQPGESRQHSLILTEAVNEAIRMADFRQQGADLGGGNKYIYLMGFVRFIDDLGIKRNMGFLRKYDAEKGALLVINNPDREYSD